MCASLDTTTHRSCVDTVDAHVRVNCDKYAHLPMEQCVMHVLKRAFKDSKCDVDHAVMGKHHADTHDQVLRTITLLLGASVFDISSLEVNI